VVKIELSELTLGTIASGALEERFQEMLDDLRQVVERPQMYAVTGEAVTSKMTLELYFVHDPQTNSMRVAVRGVFAEPKRRLVTRSVHRMGKNWYAGSDPQQMPLLGLKSTTKEGDE
jgi:hypothetical protein